MNYGSLTSNLEEFKKQLTEGKKFTPQVQQQIVRVTKNLICAVPSDYSGCGFIRCHWPLGYLNSVFGKSQKLQTVVMPFFCTQEDILVKTRSIFLQRTMNPILVPMVMRYKEIQKKLKFKMIYDIDDFIWKGNNIGEDIPDYNFGGEKFDDNARNACNQIMSLCDIICVSSEFLKKYITETIKIKNEIRVIQNTVPMFFWGNKRKEPIKERIKKPKIIWTASPTHWHEVKKLKGDMDNAWCEYIIKNVKENKIDFAIMGCESAPFFFKELEGRSNFHTIGWVISYKYHLPVLEYGADFAIGPLVPNYFNYSKSCIKMQESYASGSVFIGSTFNNGFPSPYDEGMVTIPHNCLVKDIEDCIERLSEPKEYNTILENQYKMMHEKGWYLESAKYVNKLVELFFKK